MSFMINLATQIERISLLLLPHLLFVHYVLILLFLCHYYLFVYFVSMYFMINLATQIEIISLLLLPHLLFAHYVPSLRFRRHYHLQDDFDLMPRHLLRSPQRLFHLKSLRNITEETTRTTSSL